MRILLAVVLVLLVLLALTSSAFTVDRSEYVYLTQFGAHVGTYDGEKDDQAGLHWKWPWPVQSVQRLDRRLQYFDLPETELLTQDAQGKSIDKTITVFAYVCWRIADEHGVDRFVRRIGTPDRARGILGERIRNQFGSAIGGLRMDDLINPDAAHVEQKMRELHDTVLNGHPQNDTGGHAGKGLKEQALEDYGIEIVDVQLRRTSHPLQVRDSIFERIRSERFARAAEYRSSGEKAAKDIRSEAEAKSSEIRNAAKREKYRLERNAEIRAAEIRKLAVSKDPQLYEFQKRLATFAEVIGDDSTTLWVSVQQYGDLIRTLVEGTGKAVPGIASTSKTGGQ